MLLVESILIAATYKQKTTFYNFKSKLSLLKQKRENLNEKKISIDVRLPLD
jgi:hypothetical protein